MAPGETGVAKRKTAALLIKAAVSAALIITLFRNADLRDTLSAVLRLGPGAWVSAVFLYMLGQVISAYRWKLLSGAAGFCAPLRDHVSYYFIGMFFNLFLPTSVGGDAVKCWYLSRTDPTGRTAPAIYTVLAERVTGFLVMFWMGTGALFFAPPGALPGTVFALAAACSAMSVLVMPFIPALLKRILKKRTWAWSRTLLEDIAVYWRVPAVLFKALAWSLVFHSLLVAIHIIIGRAMGLPVPAAYYVVVYSAASLAGFIPISLSGIGPREGTYLYLFTLIGIGQPDALAFGVCWLGVIIAASLPGAALYLLGGRRERVAVKGIGLPEKDEKIIAGGIPWSRKT